MRIILIKFALRKLWTRSVFSQNVETLPGIYQMGFVHKTKIRNHDYCMSHWHRNNVFSYIWYGNVDGVYLLYLNVLLNLSSQICVRI